LSGSSAIALSESFTETEVIAMQHEECLRFVSEILNILKSTHQHEKVLHLIVDRVARMYHCQTCAVVLVDPVTEYLRVALGHGLSHTFAKSFHRKLATGAIGRLLWTGSPILIRDSTEFPEMAKEVELEKPFLSAVCTTVSANHSSLGYLHVDSLQKDAFTADDVRILQSFADFAAIALHKARLLEDNLRLDKIDHETELEKYASFLERIRSAIDRSDSLHECFALMIFDVDNFKHVANTYGYDASKEMLRQIGGLIKGRLRGIDAPGRHGFDEFIVLRSNADLDDGILFADEVREAISRTSFTNYGILTTVSVGVSAYPEHASDLEGLLRSVKESLFNAQRSGRNKVSPVKKDKISPEVTTRRA
jgi:diguanylate cyclase (GGDEF)-like protein